MSLHKFLWLLLLNFCSGCLVVRSPNCLCPLVILDSSNLETELGDGSLYQNVSNYQVASPELSLNSDNCSATLTCAIGYDLVVYDNVQSYYYGEQQVNAACEKGSQVWIVDDGIDYAEILDHIYAVCVGYAPSTTTTARPLDCSNCSYTIIKTKDQVTALTKLFPAALEFYTVEYEGDAAVVITMEDNCVASWGLISNFKFAVFTDDDAYFLSWSPTCNTSTGLWSLSDEFGFEYTDLSNVSFAAVSLAPSITNCSSIALLSGTDLPLESGSSTFASADAPVANYSMVPYLNTPCYYIVSCEGANYMLYYYEPSSSTDKDAHLLANLESGNGVLMAALPQTNQWLVYGKNYSIGSLTCGSTTISETGGMKPFPVG